jgi:hypothetical protein
MPGIGLLGIAINTGSLAEDAEVAACSGVDRARCRDGAGRSGT